MLRKGDRRRITKKSHCENTKIRKHEKSEGMDSILLKNASDRINRIIMMDISIKVMRVLTYASHRFSLKNDER
jgi:hypothetical protein